jgi:hypothetical protein
MAATTDTELVRRLQTREPAAWDEVYRVYGDRLYGFAYRLSGNPGASATVTIPCSVSGRGATADATGAVVESNERNNTVPIPATKC